VGRATGKRVGYGEIREEEDGLIDGHRLGLREGPGDGREVMGLLVGHVEGETLGRIVGVVDNFTVGFGVGKVDED